VPISTTDEYIDLIREASLPLPPHRRSNFYERVSALLRNDDVLNPARVLEACKTDQGEFLSVRAPVGQKKSPSLFEG
jgi:hypothetical protein